LAQRTGDGLLAGEVVVVGACCVVAEAGAAGAVITAGVAIGVVDSMIVGPDCVSAAATAAATGVVIRAGVTIEIGG